MSLSIDSLISVVSTPTTYSGSVVFSKSGLFLLLADSTANVAEATVVDGVAIPRVYLSPLINGTHYFHLYAARVNAGTKLVTCAHSSAFFSGHLVYPNLSSVIPKIGAITFSSVIGSSPNNPLPITVFKPEANLLLYSCLCWRTVAPLTFDVTPPSGYSEMIEAYETSFYRRLETAYKIKETSGTRSIATSSNTAESDALAIEVFEVKQTGTGMSDVDSATM